MVGIDGIRSAMLTQTTITSHIAERLAAMPSNHDFIALLESVQRHTQLQQTLLDQNTLMMQYISAMQATVQHPTDTGELAQEQPESPQPREWDTSARGQYPPTPTGSEFAVPESPATHELPPPAPEEVMPSPSHDDMVVAQPSGDQPTNAMEGLQDARAHNAPRPSLR